MKEIPLTQGKVALVDDADYEWLNQWKWTLSYSKRGEAKRFYAITSVWCGAGSKRKWFSMHRLIAGATDPKVRVDHRDRDGLNNRRANIRIANATENARNKTKSLLRGKRPVTSAYLGVCRRADRPGFIAQISVKGRVIRLGVFRTAEVAARIYDIAACTFFGEFANPNIDVSVEAARN